MVRLYMRVAVKLPLPAHPVPPVSVQVPVIVLPATVPMSVSMLFVPAGNIVEIVEAKEPVTLPL